MSAHTQLKQSGEPHANEPAALPTPIGHMSAQEDTKPRAALTESRGELPQVSGAFGSRCRSVADAAPGPVVSAPAHTPAIHRGPVETPLGAQRPDESHLSERSGTADVPGEVLVALVSASGSVPPLADDADAAARAAWWDAQAQADDASAEAYSRLRQWADDTHQPGAVWLAINDARLHALSEARQSRRGAKAARAEAATTTPSQGA